MSITLNTLAYSQDTFVTPNKVSFVGPSNTSQVKDLLTLGRTAAKPTKDSDGVTRAEVKRTKTVTLASGAKVDIIVSASCSIPVGVAKADVDALRDDIGDFLISSGGDNLFWKHTITG